MTYIEKMQVLNLVETQDKTEPSIKASTGSTVSQTSHGFKTKAFNFFGGEVWLGLGVS